MGSGDEASWDPCCAFAYGGARFWSGIFIVGILRVQVYVVKVLYRYGIYAGEKS